MSPDDRALAAVPIAALLVAAVADNDRDAVSTVLATCTDWQALAVVLASEVDAVFSPKGAPYALNEDERRVLHRRHVAGDTSALVRLGEREYQRARIRKKERGRGPRPWQKDHEISDADAALFGGQWVMRGGVQRWEEAS